MNRPSSVKVGALNYQLIWESKEWALAENEIGKCDPRHQIIRIADFLSPEQTACIFAHEVSHALEWHYRCWDEITSEQACNIAGDGFVMFWRDNMDAFEWWGSLFRAARTNIDVTNIMNTSGRIIPDSDGAL